METSVCSQEVCLSFVLGPGLTKDTCAPSLICTFQACVENNLTPEWKTTEECLSLKPAKKDVFVFDPFEGEAFDYLKNSNFKCLVLGPRCLLSCVHQKMQVPELPSPIHNISMHKLIITLTGFEKEEKEELSTIITRSAGIYCNSFSEAVTHLVANNVGTKKYEVAIKRDIPIMTGEWLRAVWKAVKREYREDIYATDDQFLSYACPVFKNLVICISQMPRKNKEALKKVIEENGGTYSATLEMSVTSVLVIPTAEGEKYEHARNWRIQCLTPDWIYDSLEVGHALIMEGYEVKQRGSSTPTDENAPPMPPDVSLCSTIMNDTESSRAVTHVNETLQQSLMGDISLLKRKSVSDEHASRGILALEELDLQQALKAGLFLDGCKIFLSGFSGAHMEKLRRVLNAGGATRCSQLSDSVSHVIIGKVVEEHINTISSWSSKPHIVHGDWITESIKLQKPADETPFLHGQENQATPKRPKRGARNSQADNDETFVDEDLINKYLKPPNGNEPRRSIASENDSMNMSAFPDSQASTFQGIFHGKIFTISGYSQKVTEDYIIAIREHGGEIVSLDYKGHVHYSVTNIEGTGSVHSKADEIVSHFFLQDCFDLDKWEEPKLVDVEYYHLPLNFVQNLSPLSDCTFAISTYCGLERQFLVSLATCLGAQFQESFAKKSNPGKNIKASTHLICPTAAGEKYKAALKWKVPAITHDWLLACVKSGEREDEEPYRLNNKDHQSLNGKEILLNLFNSQLETTGSSVVVGETLVADYPSDECGPTPINNKVRALRERRSLSSPHEVKTPDMETIRKMHPTPGVSKDQSLDEMPTPDTPYGRTWEANPPARVRKAYKRLLDTLPDEPLAKRPAAPGTPMEVYYKKFQDSVTEDFKNFKVKTPVWIKNKNSGAQGNSNKEKKQVEKECDETLQEREITVAADMHGPLTGVIVCTAYKHHDQQRALYEAVAKLGGDHRWSLDNTVTHFIFQGSNNTKEFRIARDEGKIVVAPEWVWMCQEENARIDEELFPHTHNPKMTLSIVSTKSAPNSKRDRARKKHASEEDKTKTIVEEEKPHESVNNTSMQASEISETLARQLEEIEALASVSGAERRSVSRNKSISEKLKQTPTREVQIETQPATMDIPETQSTAITWDDPAEREARLKLQDEITRDTQDIINDNMQEQVRESEEDKENLPADIQNEIQDENSQASTKSFSKSVSSESQYVFVMSGMTDEEKDRYSIIIVGLDGTLNTDHYFNTSCTHILTLKPSRSEKHLAAIASGKWLLHPSFLEESAKAGRFIEEEPFEWGNPAAMNIPSMNPDSMEHKLSLCSRRWRLKFGGSRRKNRGAFQEMRAMIHSSKERVEAFTRLILAGGGEVISGTPPYTGVENITHFFIELNKNNAKIDLADFASRRIPCLQPVFLNDYLVTDPLPKESDHLIPEYREILKDMSTSNQSFLRRRQSTR